MNVLKSTVLTVIAGLVLALLCVSPVQAITVQAENPHQKTYAEEVVSACVFDLDYVEGVVGTIQITLSPDCDWPHLDGLPVNGASRWGEVWVDSDVPVGPELGEVLSHELGHQIHYAVPLDWQRQWNGLCWEGIEKRPGWHWDQDSGEAFAECARVALFPSCYWVNPPRTALQVVPVEEFCSWLRCCRYASSCPFPDLRCEDNELRAAAGYLYTEGLTVGRRDGTFGAYDPLLKRHVTLICERAGLPVVDFCNDLDIVACRGEVRDAFPSLQWLETRWEEGITRGQLARLLWRAAQF